MARKWSIDAAKKIMDRVVYELRDVAEVDQSPRLELRRMTMTLKPRRTGGQA